MKQLLSFSGPLALFLTPKCPACIVAAVGLGAWAMPYASYLVPTLWTVFAVALFLWIRGRRRKCACATES